MDYSAKFLEINSPESLLKQIEERDNLDYKKQFDDTPKGKADFIKDYAAIANHGGGVIIYGVDGRDLVGIQEAELPKYDTSRIHDKLKGHLSPVPKIISQIVSFDDKNFPFVKIAGIDQAPILISKKMHDEKNNSLFYDGDLYIRQNTQTLKASNEAHVRHVLDQVINSQVAERLSMLNPILKQFGAGAISGSIEARPKVEIEGESFAKSKPGIESSMSNRQVVLVPKGRSPSFNKNEIKKSFEVEIGLHGHQYPHDTVSGNEQSGVTKLNDGFVSWWGLGSAEKQWKCITRELDDGSFFWMGTLFEDDVATRTERGTEKFKDGIGIVVTQYFVHMALFHALKYIKELGDTGIWSFTYRLNNVANRKLIIEDALRMGFHSDKKSFENTVEIKIEFKAEDLESNMEKYVLDICTQIFERFNWSNPNIEQMKRDFQKSVENIRLKGGINL